jgi:hypothetical protein
MPVKPETILMSVGQKLCDINRFNLRESCSKTLQTCNIGIEYSSKTTLKLPVVSLNNYSHAL